MFRKLLALVPIVTLLNVTPALADPRFDWVVDAKLLVVEPTYMPNSITVMIDGGAGSCPKGTVLTWNGQGATDSDRKDNVKAVLATLLTAISSNKTVRLFGYNNGCQLRLMNILNN